jgi:hypothetical protein
MSLEAEIAKLELDVAKVRADLGNPLMEVRSLILIC